MAKAPWEDFMEFLLKNKDTGICYFEYSSRNPQETLIKRAGFLSKCKEESLRIVIRFDSVSGEHEIKKESEFEQRGKLFIIRGKNGWVYLLSSLEDREVLQNLFEALTEVRSEAGDDIVINLPLTLLESNDVLALVEGILEDGVMKEGKAARFRAVAQKIRDADSID